MTVIPEIYLDNAATTRPWPEAVEAVVYAMGDAFGNASSLHRRGLAAARAIAKSQEAIAALVGGGNWKVIFTSGGSEADALAVLGNGFHALARLARQRRARLGTPAQPL